MYRWMVIELVPDTKSYVVEVAASSVTRIDFDMQAKYSAAGQVTDTQGNPALEQKVLLKNSDGEVMMQTYTDQFGYFRVDNLSNGNYQLEVLDSNDRVISQREFDIVGDFLFDVDLTIPVQ